MKNFAVVMLLCGAISFSFNQKAHLENIWWNGEKTSKIQIYKGSDNKYYGKIIWLKTPNENGKPRTDIENPDEKLRSRPLMNLIVLKDFKLSTSDPNVLEGGSIYDPNTGKTYCGKITYQVKHLKLRGHICGWSWLGRSTSWDLVE
jgi:uncharacterized protein (DUF2147 family)